MSSCHLSSHRYKTFSSKLQYQMVLRAIFRLQESGFYWSSINGKEAGSMLASQPSGTFLIRDSADQQHFFTLSVKTSSGTKNVRVQCDNSAFFLQTEPEGERAAPRFDCMLKLVTHYMFSRRDSTSKGNQRSPYYIHSGGEKIPLELLRPFSSTMASLKHLCRKTVNGLQDISNKSDELPQTIKNYLDEYDASI